LKKWAILQKEIMLNSQKVLVILCILNSRGSLTTPPRRSAYIITGGYFRKVITTMQEKKTKTQNREKRKKQKQEKMQEREIRNIRLKAAFPLLKKQPYKAVYLLIVVALFVVAWLCKDVLINNSFIEPLVNITKRSIAYALTLFNVDENIIKQLFRLVYGIYQSAIIILFVILFVETAKRITMPNDEDVYRFQTKLIIGRFIKECEVCPALISKTHVIMNFVKLLRLEYHSISKSYEDWTNDKTTWESAMSVTHYEVRRGIGNNSIVLYVIDGVPSDDDVVEVSHEKY
jgi:hypothetical protein